GLHYGPKFRTVRELRVSAKSAWARIQQTFDHEELRSHLELGFRVHPAVIDGAFHCAAGAIRASEIAKDPTAERRLKKERRVMVPYLIDDATINKCSIGGVVEAVINLISHDKSSAEIEVIMRLLELPKTVTSRDSVAPTAKVGDLVL